MKATIGISKENKNGIWEHWNKAIDEEQYNKIIEIVGECEDYYDFKEDYKAWNKENKKIDKSKLMKLITQRFTINKSNCDILENITLKFGEHKIMITQEDLKNYFRSE